MEEDVKKQFLSLYDAYADALFRHCYFRIYDRELAKDLVQETFCRTWAYLSTGKKIKNIRAFLYRILRNVIVDEIRKKKHLSLDQMTEEGFSPAYKFVPNIEQQLVAKDVIKKLKLLDAPYREIVQMRFIDDLSVKEISSILGISVNAVSVRVHRGVRKLRGMTEKED